MSILEDLDLMDLLDELPADSDFNLDDILFEFSTPGLFSAPEETKIEEPPVAEEVPAPAAPQEPAVQEAAEEVPVPLQEAEDLPPVQEVVAPAVIEEEDIADVPEFDWEFTAEEETDFTHNDNTTFGDSMGLCDILFEFGTPVDEEGVKLYTPSTQAQVEDDEDDVKVYVPETVPVTAAPKEEVPERTVLFDALELKEETEPVAEAPAQPKAPGFFAKAAGLVMGLFAGKKAVKAAAPAPQTEENDYLTLFTQENPVAEELPAEEIAEEVDAAIFEEAEAPAEIEWEEIAEAAEDSSVFEEDLPAPFTNEAPVEEEPVPEAEEALLFEEEEEVISVDEEPAELLSEAEEAPEAAAIAEVETDAFNDITLFDDSSDIEDILFALDTVEAVEDTDLTEFSFTEEAEDDVKVYIPEEAPEAEHIADEPEHTAVFNAAELIEEPVQPAAEVPAQPKAPGFFAKAAGLVMGLFAGRKSAKAAAPAAESMEEDTVSLFTRDIPAEEDEISVFGLTDDILSAEETNTVSEADLLFLFADEEAFEDETLPEEIAPIAEETEPVAEEPTSVIDEAEIPFIAEEAVPVTDEAELAPVTEEEEHVFISIDEETIPVLDDAYAAEELSEATPAADDSALFEDSLDINDILFELSVSDTEGNVDLPVFDTAEDDIDEIKVYAPEVMSEAATEKNEDSTIIFGSIDLSAVPAPAEAQPVAVQSKTPGFFAKAAGLVMGLLAGKKKPSPVTPAPQPASSVSYEDDPFASMSDLFIAAESDDLSDMDALMLELEMQVEREAELEAETAAREAAERLAMEEEQKALELEAQRLAQAEADAEAEARRLKAEEEARMKAEADALLKQLQAEEEERQALAEDELFEWIEAAEKRREAAAMQTEPVAAESPVVDETTVILAAPVLSEAPAESNAPVYDYAAVELPSQTQEYTAPQMNISIDEEVPEEVGDLLEMPDVEQPTAESEETPEEAAARKKKEDDNLHYKPEESTAKAVTSHIGKRFGAAFAAFTESDKDGDDEEALGPELPANKAYRFFNRFISAYRFRLRVSVVLCVILGWISLGLPVFGSLKNPAAAAAMCLMILLTVMLAGADILAVGVRNLIGKRASIHSLVAVSCFASVIDAIVIIATKGVGGYLPFCGVSAISMCFAIYGSLLYCRSQRLNFKTLDRATEPMTISVDYGIVEEGASTVYRSPGHPEGYIHHSEEEDLSETVFGIMAPIMIPAIPVMTLIAALFSGGFGDFFHIMAAMFAAAASFGALIAFPLPYFLVQKELYGTKAAIAGWAGAREIGRVSNMIVTDRDLFPDDTVSIKSVRIVDNVPPQLTLSYMCSVIHHSGSCLVPAFTQLAENNDCELLDVENFQCHEAGGLSGEIGPDSVLVASHSYMKLQGFRIPARKKDSENALFLAVNGHVIAYIIVDYKPIKSVRAGLQSALRGNVEMIFAARDFNVTPLLISKKFKSATETLRFPSYSQRYEITSQVNSETAACAAVVYRKSFYSYAVVVEKARYLYNSVSWGVILSAVSSIMGVLLMFIMALTGAGAAVTVGRLLVFMLLWLIPTLALTISITK